MEHRIKSGDTIRIDDDKWDHMNEYYVHVVQYKENSTAVTLVLEDDDCSTFTVTVASHQLYKVD